MPRPNFQWTIGESRRTCQVGEPEQGWLTGSSVRTWWLYFSWWVIPLGVIWLFFGPRLGQIGFGSSSTPTAPPQVIERVVERPIPKPVSTPVPTVQPTAPRELTPEERAEQYKEERRQEYGIR